MIASDFFPPQFKNLDGLKEDCLNAKRMGFAGKFSIHPLNLDMINETFQPTEAEIDLAQRVVAAYREAAAQGRGSTSVDGMMVDMPVFRRALQTLGQTE